MKQKLIHSRYFQVCAALLAADCLVFTVVNPTKASAPWLIIGFALLGSTLFTVAGVLAGLLRGYGERPYHYARRFLRYGAAVAILLVGLQSIGQLTARDVLTLLPLAIIAYLYFGYGRKTAANSE